MRRRVEECPEKGEGGRMRLGYGKRIGGGVVGPGEESVGSALGE